MILASTSVVCSIKVKEEEFEEEALLVEVEMAREITKAPLCMFGASSSHLPVRPSSPSLLEQASHPFSPRWMIREDESAILQYSIRHRLR